MKTSFSQKEFYCKCKGFVLLLWQLTLDPKDPKVWLSLLYKMLNTQAIYYSTPQHFTILTISV